MGSFIFNSLRNAGGFAIAYCIIGIIFWNRPLTFMISSIVTNIPLLLGLGAFVEAGRYAELLFGTTFEGSQESPDVKDHLRRLKEKKGKGELMKSLRESTGCSWEEIVNAYEKGEGDEPKIKEILNSENQNQSSSSD